MSQHYLAMVPWTDEDRDERQTQHGNFDSREDALVNGYRLEYRGLGGNGFGDGYFNNYLEGDGKGDWLACNGSGEFYGYCG